LASAEAPALIATVLGLIATVFRLDRVRHATKRTFENRAMNACF
jgi:hypothetical protein